MEFFSMEFFGLVLAFLIGAGLLYIALTPAEQLPDFVRDLFGGLFPSLKEVGVHDPDYKIAKDSVQALACAINSVLKAEFTSETCPEAEPPELTQLASIIPLVRAHPAEKCYGKTCVECELEEVEIEYEEDNKWTKLSNVWFTYMDGEWHWKSPDLKSVRSEAALYATFFDSPTIQYFYNEGWLDPVFNEIHNKMIREERYKDLREGAKVIQDIANSKDDDEVWVYYPDGREEFRTSKKKFYDLPVLVRSAKCSVKDFNMPQEFTPVEGITDPLALAKRSIENFGVPKFLAYYQSFPMSEVESWQDFSKWYEDVGTLTFAAFCMSHMLKPLALGAKLVVRTVKSLPSAVPKVWTAMKGKAAWVKDAFKGPKVWPEFIISDVSKRTRLVEKLATGALNSRYITKLSKAYPKNVEGAWIEFLNTAPKVTALARTSTEYKQIYSAFKSSFEKGTIAVEHNFVKYLTKEAQEEIVSGFLRAEAYKAAGRAATVMGIPIATYFVLRAENEFGIFDPYSNSVVLQFGLDYENNKTIRDAFDLVDATFESQFGTAGRPVILETTEWMGGIKPFHVVSPCHTDLEVKSYIGSCALYTYDQTTSMTTCDQPDYTGWWQSFKDNYLGLDKMYECAHLYSYVEPVGTPNFVTNEIKATKNMGYMWSDKTKADFPARAWLKEVGEDEIVISDPINQVDYYYNPKTNAIDFLVATPARNGIEGSYNLRNKQGSDEWGFGLWEAPGSEYQRQVTFRPTGTSSQRYFWTADGIGCVRSFGLYSMGKAGLGAHHWTNLDDIYMGLGSSSGGHVCHMRQIMGKAKKGSSYFSYMSDVTIWWNTFEMPAEDDPEKIVSKSQPFALEIVIDRDVSGIRQTKIILMDSDGDRKYDIIHHYSRLATPKRMEERPRDMGQYEYQDRAAIDLTYRGFVDADDDGAADIFHAHNCFADMVSVTPDMDPYDDEPNWCYKKKYDSVLSLVTMTAAIVGSSLAKVLKLGGVKGWLLAVGIDCGLAYAAIQLKSSWPGS